LGCDYFRTTNKEYRINSNKQLENKLKLLIKSNVIVDANILKNILYDVTQLNIEPLYRLFLSYPSLVQQISEKLNKKINKLHIEGDHSLFISSKFRNFVKSLVHIYRNCIDHGIEDPETRILNNKNEYGTIKTNFKKQYNNIIIEISDDGIGINTEKIIQKALEKNIYTKEHLNNLNDQEKLNIIFDENISTNDQVTKISGRGIGLTAVKEELNKLEGRIEIISKHNKGTLFRFTIPIIKNKTITKELNVITKQITQYFKESFELDIKSIEPIDNYNPVNNITSLEFTGELNSICSVDISKELIDYLAAILIPDGFSQNEIEQMKNDIPNEFLNTFTGLAINEFKKKHYENINITVPSVIEPHKFKQILKESTNHKFVSINTYHGKIICSLIKKIVDDIEFF